MSLRKFLIRSNTSAFSPLLLILPWNYYTYFLWYNSLANGGRWSNMGLKKSKVKFKTTGFGWSYGIPLCWISILCPFPCFTREIRNCVLRDCGCMCSVAGACTAFINVIYGTMRLKGEGGEECSRPEQNTNAWRVKCSNLLICHRNCGVLLPCIFNPFVEFYSISYSVWATS